MYSNSVLAITGVLVAAVAAVPMAEMHHHHHKREYVWITKIEEAVVTVPVTKTVWIEPGETPPTHYSAPDVSPAGYSKEHSSSVPAYTPESTTTSSSIYVAPTSSSSSVYVAPTSSSSSVYVAPTSSTSSVYVAPTTSTSVYVAPTPSSTYVAPTAYAASTTSSAAAAAYTSASSSSGSGLTSGLFTAGTDYTGDLTWYAVGLGACGWTNTADEPIVAISAAIFDSYSTGNPNTNPLCGKYVTITGKSGSSYKAKIVDRCPGCSESDLDLSQDFFNTVTEYGNGRVSGMKWTCD